MATSDSKRGRTYLLAIKVGHNVLHTLEPGVGTVLFDPVIELAIHHFQGSGVATGNGRVSKGEESGAYAGTNEVTKSCNIYVNDWQDVVICKKITHPCSPNWLTAITRIRLVQACPDILGVPISTTYVAPP